MKTSAERRETSLRGRALGDSGHVVHELPAPAGKRRARKLPDPTPALLGDEVGLDWAEDDRRVEEEAVRVEETEFALAEAD